MKIHCAYFNMNFYMNGECPLRSEQSEVCIKCLQNLGKDGNET
jgi:hypothetical protein